MKQNFIVTLLTSIAALICFYAFSLFIKPLEKNIEPLKVGFVYDSDASTPYSYNFIRAQKEAEFLFGDRIQTVVKNNVPESDCEEAIQELIDEKCRLIITNSYGFGETAKRLALENPEIQFCAATCDNANTKPFCPNYHTFMGEIYQGRYISGAVAGLKLRELIKNNIITPEQAKLGYVAAYPYPEVISGYTAFFLGARSFCPSATMEVIYSNTWCNYSLEKEIAGRLIDDDCIIISQHSDTIGPAAVCEEAALTKTVYHIGYNHSMMDVAPTTSLVSTRINWSPYITGAIKAVLEHKNIEHSIGGHIHGNDIGAGLEKNWVQILECNRNYIAPNTEKIIRHIEKNFIRGRQKVFHGNYTGVNPYNPDDTYNLSVEFKENKNSSAPAFNYILKDVITIVE